MGTDDFAGLDGRVEEGKPAIVEVSGVADAAGWAERNREALYEVVARHGAVLVRGLGLRGAEDPLAGSSMGAEDPLAGSSMDAGVAGVVLRTLGTELMAEREAFATRDSHGDGVYSSSKWPPNQPMCMHHELSYALEFPGLMLFACLSAPTEGGATAVADSARVLAALPADLVERFEREGWLLTRCYNDEIGLSWAEAFGTSDKAEVEEYCSANGISFEWTSGGLRTSQRRSAVATHPGHGEKLWFNQIAFLNQWTMAPEVREYLVDVYGQDNLPFNTRFGDGGEITQDVVEVINKTYDSVTLREPWQAGDLMLVDNLRMAHSREAFEGPREVLVALGLPVPLAACSPTAPLA
ncbi:TauD/TfdA family dioxygenase [Allokutzneria albata]|uniref:Taurine dioxygenase, alpha-ketoglutarate-dependent n=1 Tax=Allokutzneria albata TaxID=211114 RepID=A0A1G9WQA9_ALLAB|nr:TauD/TfdA family dioxygenase [Allokutzneria albata]SDM86650.1 Taurine dioxygenase, alpha-ketoglutarate-dependent [Allokutzneria albata]